MFRVPFFAGTTNLDQLKIIYSALGSPTEEEWPVRTPASLLALVSRAREETRRARADFRRAFCFVRRSNSNPSPTTSNSITSLSNSGIFTFLLLDLMLQR